LSIYEWPDPWISRFPRELIGSPSNFWRTRAPRSPPGQRGRGQFASGAAGDALYSVAHHVLFPLDGILATNGCAGQHNLNMAPAGFRASALQYRLQPSSWCGQKGRSEPWCHLNFRIIILQIGDDILLAALLASIITLPIQMSWQAPIVISSQHRLQTPTIVFSSVAS